MWVTWTQRGWVWVNLYSLLVQVIASSSQAWVTLASPNGPETRTVSEPARLTYDATRHNWSESYRVDLVPPLEGVAALKVHCVGMPGHTDEWLTASLLGPDGVVLREVQDHAPRRIDPPARIGRVWLPWAGTR